MSEGTFQGEYSWISPLRLQALEAASLNCPTRSETPIVEWHPLLRLLRSLLCESICGWFEV